MSRTASGELSKVEGAITYSKVRGSSTTHNSSDKERRWFVTDIIGVCVQSAVVSDSGVRTRLDSSQQAFVFDMPTLLCTGHALD